ncbi:hypothetical protein LXL04_032366 [Taraxacum kok-saghyz]
MDEAVTMKCSMSKIEICRPDLYLGLAIRMAGVFCGCFLFEIDMHCNCDCSHGRFRQNKFDYNRSEPPSSSTFKHYLPGRACRSSNKRIKINEMSMKILNELQTDGTFLVKSPRKVGIGAAEFLDDPKLGWDEINGNTN